MTTYTPAWRLAIIPPGAPAVKDVWGAIQDATMPLMEQGAVGVLDVSVNGLTTYTLSTANNAPDEARYLTQNYTGALTGNCTVTMPNVTRVGWGKNSTTGGHSILLTTGGGAQATIPPDQQWYFWWSNGGNVALVPIGLGSLTTVGNVSVGGNLAVTGTSAFTGAVTVPNGTTGARAVNFSQFAPNASTPGHVNLPGGVTIQWGNNAGPTATVGFDVAFSGTPWTIQTTLKDGPGGGSAVFVQVTTAYDATGFTAVTITAPGVGVAAGFFWVAIGPT